MQDHDDSDYMPGYKRPPLHSRFKPGQSGNPKGRPKKETVRRTLLDELDRELGRKVSVLERGKKTKMTVKDVIVKSYVKKAMEGDAKALSWLIKLLAELEQIQDSIPVHYVFSWLKDDPEDIKKKERNTIEHQPTQEKP